MTTTTASRYRAYRGPALFSMGFRPFFLFAALWAAIAVPIWVATFAGWLPAAHFNRDWHAHEMVFGYLSAVIAGFLLTAVPNWTGRLPVTGPPLMGLVALWCAGRAAMFAPNFALAPAIDAAFLFVFALTIGREILAGRSVRNLPVLALLTTLAIANVLSHLRAIDPAIALIGERIGVAVVSMLVALIGGRIVPSFTRNWMAKRRLQPEPAPASRFDAVALGATAPALALWVAMPTHFATGLMLTLAGVLHLARLARWQGWRTHAEPLVLILHVGYLWLSAGLLLTGLAILPLGIVPVASGLHALTAGAFGVMTRASLGHTGQPLTASPRISVIYVLVNIGALLRVLSPYYPDFYTVMLAASAVAWSGAFVWFAIVYAPLLLRSRVSTAQ
jgi:uncharacterized protein involved in response to NO